MRQAAEPVAKRPTGAASFHVSLSFLFVRWISLIGIQMDELVLRFEMPAHRRSDVSM
jgi:hypothetical protein